MESDNRNQRIAKNSILLSIRLFVVILLTFYATRALLNLLGIEDYGIYNVVCGFVLMFAFLNTSMSNGIQRFFNVELGKGDLTSLKKIYITSLYIQLMLVVFVVLTAETIGLWYLRNKMIIPEERQDAAELIFHASILYFVFLILQAPYVGAVLAHEKMNFFALMSMFDALMKLLIIFAAPMLGYDNLVVYGYLFALVGLLNLFFYYIYTRKNFEEIRHITIWDKQTFISMMSFSGWNLFGSFSGVLKEQGINLILNFFYGPIVNAARGIANQINGGLQNFVYNLSTSVRPQVIQSYAVGNIERTMNLTYSISKLSNCLLYLISMPVLCEINIILKMWLGDKVADHTNNFVIIIVLISYINNMNMAVSGVVHASGKMKYYQLGTSFICILALPVSYYLLQFNTPPEIALLMVLLFVSLSQIFSMVYLKKIINYSFMCYYKKVIRPFLILVISTFYIPFVFRIFFDEGVLRLIFLSISFVPFCLIIIYFFILEESEKKLVNNIINSIKCKILN